jgi:putative phosphoesterase
MKVGVISDTHGCEARWALAYNKYLQHTELIIHAGDILYHGPRNPILKDYNPAALAEQINHCPVPILIARGNCDSEVDAMVLDLPVQAPYAYAMIDGMRIVVTHGHTTETDKEKDIMAQHMKADLFISGHVHVNVLEKRGNTIFLNPGSPSLSKRTDGRSTIAMMDDEKIEIIDIDTDEVILQMAIK